MPSSQREPSEVEADYGATESESASDFAEDDADTERHSAGPGSPAEPDDKGRFCRRGIPCTTAGIEQIGEQFVRVSASWMDNVSDVDVILGMRSEWLRRRQRGDRRIISLRAVRELTKEHFRQWEAQRPKMWDELLARCGTSTAAG